MFKAPEEQIELIKKGEFEEWLIPAIFAAVRWECPSLTALAYLRQRSSSTRKLAPVTVTYYST